MYTTKVPMIKAMVLLVVMYGCESRTQRLRADKVMLSNCGAGEDT